MISHLPGHNVQMNSFIITTAEGKIIVIDGGYRRDAEKLLKKLREISGCHTPHVDAWFLSHIHNDHVDAFLELVEHNDTCFSCEALYCNFPSMQYVEKYEPKEYHTYEEFMGLLPKFASYVRTVSIGDTYQIGSAKFDVLFTPDTDITGAVINNSSIIFRMTLNEKTVMFLGDASVAAGKKLLARYGDALKSDLVQMAHHGQGGVSKDVYTAISPEACLWCAPDWLWDNNAGKGFNTHVFKTVEVRGWMDELNVKTHYVTKDGDISIEL